MPKRGKIITPPDANVWPWEYKTAKTLAQIGITVEFIRKSNKPRATSADAFLDGVKWEMKSPTADNLKAIRRNLREARWQSDKIVFDSRRMKKVPDVAIERELSAQFKQISGITRIRFINRHGIVSEVSKQR